jgi:hypothetical protein
MSENGEKRMKETDLSDPSICPRISPWRAGFFVHAFPHMVGEIDGIIDVFGIGLKWHIIENKRVINER